MLCRPRHKPHFLRNVLAAVPKGSAEMAAATIRTIFAQPGPAQVGEQLDLIAGMLGRQFPKVEAMLRDAAEDITAFAAFPISHCKTIWSTNPLERLNKEIKRRTDVVGVFPNPEALLRLADAVLVETHDEWRVGERRYRPEGSMALLATPAQNPKEVATPALLTAWSLPSPLAATAKTTYTTPRDATSCPADRSTLNCRSSAGITAWPGASSGGSFCPDAAEEHAFAARRSQASGLRQPRSGRYRPDELDWARLMGAVGRGAVASAVDAVSRYQR
jgi:Transposase, Mutator family